MGNLTTASERRAALRQGFALLLIVTVMFAVLYFPCVFQGMMYGYQDIGRDTQNQYLPNMVYALRSFKTGEVDVYRLDRGLGEYYPSLLYKYINGVNLPLLLFGEGRLAWGVLGATYLKYLVVALFSWLFFRRLFGHGLIPVCCALVWTYCGYSVLWGQHYHLLTSICAFTIEIYGLQLFLESDRKAFLLIPAAACMAYTGYFYLWMGSFFVLGYSLCYMIFRGERPLTILKKALLCVGCFIWAFFIAGEYMFPGVEEFIESTRGSNIANAGEAGGLLYGSDYLYAFLARMLSQNLLGVGNGYKGPANYYEIAFTGTGILFFFAMSVLLLDRRTRGRTAGLLTLCGLLTCAPFTSKLFSMRETTQRWSFILLLAETIGIGFGLKTLFSTGNMAALRRKAYNALLLSDAVCCCLFVGLWLGQKQAGVTVSAGLPMLWFFVLLVAYNLLVVALLQKAPAWSYSFADFKRVALAAITLLACVEIILLDYPAINDRGMLTRADWRKNMYYDGTEVAAQWIAARDDDLYRVGKTYESVSRNDELVQGFNGVAVYNSLNSRWLVNYYAQMGYDISNSSTYTGSNYIRFLCQDEAETGLLGVRYIIAKGSERSRPVNLLGFARWRRDKNAELDIYRNDVVSSFGYLYDTRLGAGEVSRFGSGERRLQMTKGYFLTEDAPMETESEEDADEEEIVFVEAPEIGLFTKVLMDSPVYGQVCELEELDLPESNLPLRVKVTVNAPAKTTLKVTFITQSEEYTDRTNSGNITVAQGRQSFVVPVRNFRDLQTLRLTAEKSLWIEAIELEYEDRSVVAENVRRLYENGSVKLSQAGNRFGGTVENPGGGKMMLCVPLIYSQHWHATLDGESVALENINGGLIGLEIAPGEHEVELTYKDSMPSLGRLSGAVSFALYLLAFALFHFVRRRRKRAAAASGARG